MAVTSIGDNDSVLSWTLFGESGSERMRAIGQDTNPCPMLGGQPTSISGFWGKEEEGLGGASVLLTDVVHAEIHYLYDDNGNPVWLQAAGAVGDGVILSQFEGFCPTCAESGTPSVNVGVLTPMFSSDMEGNWNLNYMLESPLSGDINRDDLVVKISDVRACD